MLWFQKLKILYLKISKSEGPKSNAENVNGYFLQNPNCAGAEAIRLPITIYVWWKNHWKYNWWPKLMSSKNR